MIAKRTWRPGNREMRDIPHYILPDRKTPRWFGPEVARRFTTRLESTQSWAQTIYDTFDWRLFKKNLILIRESRQFVLANFLNQEVIARTDWEKTPPPRFWWDLPEGPLRQELKSLLDVRALLELIEVSKNARLRSIQNDDKKTVLRYSLVTYATTPPRGKPHKIYGLELEPIRGYFKDLRVFQRFLKDLKILPAEESAFIHLLRAQGLDPGGYSSKFRLDLIPEIPAADALRLILRYLIDIMRHNESGVKTDLDTEFLHDYRVAIRRIRSALGQVKGVFPQDIADRFREEFRELGQATNTLRDLDVYLLKKEIYRSQLPEHLAPGLNSLFRDLARQRNREHKTVLRALNSSGYRKIVQHWERFLEKDQPPGADGAPHAATPILELAKEFISRRYRRIIRAGSKITDASPDEDLHRLRINCKKLRYLLEFFASLFPPGDIDRIIGQLKKLQDNLGDFNDLFMQQQYLKEYLGGLDPAKKSTPSAAAAIGGLITCLHQRQNKVRMEFKKRFRVFSSQENRSLFKTLFQEKAGAGENT
jgi:CHAD domain-containing protein